MATLQLSSPIVSTTLPLCTYPTYDGYSPGADTSSKQREFNSIGRLHERAKLRRNQLLKEITQTQLHLRSLPTNERTSTREKLSDLSARFVFYVNETKITSRDGNWRKTLETEMYRAHRDKASSQKAISLSLCEDMEARLPRELRDMICHYMVSMGQEFWEQSLQDLIRFPGALFRSGNYGNYEKNLSTMILREFIECWYSVTHFKFNLNRSDPFRDPNRDIDHSLLKLVSVINVCADGSQTLFNAQTLDFCFRFKPGVRIVVSLEFDTFRAQHTGTNTSFERHLETLFPSLHRVWEAGSRIAVHINEKLMMDSDTTTLSLANWMKSVRKFREVSFPIRYVSDLTDIYNYVGLD